MFYYLFEYLETHYQLPGAGLFQYLSFRASIAFIFSIFIALIYGKKLIALLQKKQVKEEIRALGFDDESAKSGTPTMGGLIIILATMVPTLLFAKTNNIYIIMLIVTTIWMGLIGFLDDYIKVFKNDKKGLKGKFKVLGQIGLGLIIGFTMYFHPNVTIKEEATPQTAIHVSSVQAENLTQELKSTKTTIPFVKDNEFDYADLLFFIEDTVSYSWLIFIPIVIFIITAVSNGANLTDGLDGLAGGTSIIIALTLGIFAWVSGNIIFSNYLNIMYIPKVGEISVYIAAFMGALVGFLWYNTYPAQVFMGDTGSLTIGGIIAVIAIMIRKELLIPILCGVFLIETLSVMIQVFYFKMTRRKYGEGKRVFLMAPIHHHYRKLGIHESKIVSRFWIISVVLAVVSIITLKIR